MASERVAVRYVKSLLTLAEEQHKTDQVHEDMLMFSRVVKENRSLMLVLRNPIVKDDKKSDILHAIFGKKVSALTLSFFDIICRKGREGILPQIAETLHLVYNASHGIGEASIMTAFPLDKKLREEITELAKRLCGEKKVELKEEVDEDLIGGFVLNVGDRQVDTSLRSSLNKLKIQFTSNS